MSFLTSLLKPLARLCVERGWLFSDVTEEVRRAFLDAGVQISGEAATDSKLSLLTGLQRRDIARLRSTLTPRGAARHPLAEIVSRWHGDPAFDTTALPVRGETSFDTLARAVRTDVHPRTFLNQLIETGTVQREGDVLRLVHRTYEPLAGSDDQLAYLAANVGDHLEVAVDNVTQDARRPELAVHYEGLSEAAIARLRDHWTTQSRALLLEMDAMARAVPASDNGRYRFRAGHYFHDTKQEPER